VLQTSVTLELRRCCSHDIYASKPRNMKYVQEFGFKLMSAHILPTRQCTIKGQQTTRNFSKTCTELRSKLLLCSYRWAKKINSASNENAGSEIGGMDEWVNPSQALIFRTAEIRNPGNH